jgi:hypothetical protein
MRKPFKTLIRQKSGSFLCPKCSSIVIWSCPLSDIGYAYCSKSLYSTQTIPIYRNSIGLKNKSYCDWKGKVKRKNKKIIIICNR